MRSIGGYFEMEFRSGRAMYAGLIALNSARNALVYLIKAKKIKSIYLPYYNCHVVACAVACFCPETKIHYYHVDSNFTPILDDIPRGEALYYVNYYGLQGNTLRVLETVHIILDNAQAFYSPPIPNGDTIYCPRKFFGVPDGGYLQTNALLDQSLEFDTSWDHATHLLKRIDCGASVAYDEFQIADAALTGKPLMKMSRLTQRILSGIDYESVKKKRRKNFDLLHRFLGKQNALFSLINLASDSDNFVPLCYPYMTDNAESVRRILITNMIYIPIYWPELKGSSVLNEFERSFVHQIVCLPIDQRYCEAEMKNIVEAMKGTSL